MNYKWISAGIIVCFVQLLPSIAQAGGYTELPRYFGSFKLGMTVKAFSHITRIKPEACPICIKDEVFASLDSDTLDQLGIDERSGSGVDFFFYKNKLFHIAAGTNDRDLFSATVEYETQFGGPGVKILRKNGTALLKWEDNNTVITLNYRAENNEVFSINYIDWNIKEERDWRESLTFETLTKDAEPVAQNAAPFN